jgi:phospholipase/carboxylesterase
MAASRLTVSSWLGFPKGPVWPWNMRCAIPGRCGAFIVLTGALVGPPDTVWPSSPGLLAGAPVLLTGSDADDWISDEQSRHTARILEGLGANVRLRVYHGRPHIVSEDELNEARVFLRTLLRD